MKIGFIGLGIMGQPMCENILQKHDDDLFVFDSQKDKVDYLATKGAIACIDACSLAKKSDVIISMVPKSEHSMEVYKTILPELNEKKICIDMSTIDPSVSIEISKFVNNTGAKFIDAPVVKSQAAAISATLGIYVGGDIEIYKKVKHILLYMGNNIIHLGANGKGLVMKIAHNALVSQIQNGVNETISLAMKNDISVEDYAKAVSYGGGQNFYLDSKAKAIAENNFTTAFSVENMAKDINICLTLAKECSVDVPGVEVAKKVYDKSLALGFAKEDFSATIKTVRDN